MKLPSARIKSTDFEDKDKDLVEVLGRTLNPFIDRLVIGANKNFTVDENLPFEFKTLDIKVDSNGKPLLNGTISTTLTNFKGFICINVLDVTNSGVFPNSQPFLITQTNANTVTISKITGLSANITYRLILLGIS